MAPRSENEHVERMDNNFSSRVSHGSKHMITAGSRSSSLTRPFAGPPGQLPVLGRPGLTGNLLVSSPVAVGTPGAVGLTVTVGSIGGLGVGEALGSPLCDGETLGTPVGCGDGETLGTPVGCGDGETLGTTDGETEGPGLGAESLV